MDNAPILFLKNGLWHRKCDVCPKLITHKYKSQIRQKTCSHSCQLKGNKLRVGLTPVNAFKKGENVGADNHKWQGDNVGYFALHDWVARQLGRPKKCENCGATKHKKFEWANLSGKYRRDINDWVRLCKMCHVLIDNSARGLNYNH